MECLKCNTKNPEDSKFCKECAEPLEPLKGISVTKTLKTSRISPGKTIAGKYEILSEIGRGGMGIVYKAKDIKLNRNVALKFLPAELMQDKKAKARFIQEAQAAATLDHPNICVVHEVDESDDQIFISMSYIDGESLKDRLKAGPLEIDEANDIIIQVAGGLSEAHEKGIVHRDIKPGNIMLTKKGQAKITDFGLAKLSWGVDLTKTSTIVGTVAYMSPEQAKGEEVDHRTDIWALGAMLYEILTSERPFKKSQEHALIYEILNEDPPAITSLRPDIPSHIEKVAKKALSKKLSMRYQNIEELIQDLKHPPSISLERVEKSIAVLPFEDMSPGKDQEYFCDGISEEIINSLTHIRNLKVIARTSAFAFKGKHEDIREIGRKLDVETLLEGSVRKSGNRLRIMAQLINVADGSHLWSERYDRNMEDIFDIQDEISLAIVNNLKVKLLGEEKEGLVKHRTENQEAYNLYLKGRYFAHQLTVRGLEEAIECFQQALKLDPKYALAHSGLAETYVLKFYYGEVPLHKTYPEAKVSAIKALEINDTLGEVHAYLGTIYNNYDYNPEKAEVEFKKALKLNPTSSDVHYHYSVFLAIAGRHKEAIIEAKRAQELDPLSSYISAHVGMWLWFAGMYDDAIEEVQKALKMDPNFYLLHAILGYAYRGKLEFKKAISEFKKAVELSEGLSYYVTYLAITYYEFGNKDKAMELIASLKERSRDEYVRPSLFFLIYLVLGDQDKALEWLEQALKERDSFLLFLKTWPVDCLRIPDEPKFQALLKKYGLE